MVCDSGGLRFKKAVTATLTTWTDNDYYFGPTASSRSSTAPLTLLPLALLCTERNKTVLLLQTNVEGYKLVINSDWFFSSPTSYFIMHFYCSANRNLGVRSRLPFVLWGPRVQFPESWIGTRKITQKPPSLTVISYKLSNKKCVRFFYWLLVIFCVNHAFMT